MRHCHVIFAVSVLFVESFSFSVSVKTTGIDHTAVLADSNKLNRTLGAGSQFGRLKNTSWAGGKFNVHIQ